MTDKLKSIHRQLQTPKTADGRIWFHPILMMHASHIIGDTYADFMRDHRRLVAANMKCLELYDHDAVSVISDPYRETAAFGAKVYFDGNYAPKADRLVQNGDDISRLKNPDVYNNDRTLDRIKGVELFRKELGSMFPVIGWVEGPMAEAADLMGMGELMMEMMLSPDNVKRLGEKTLRTAKDFALAQIEAGANIIGVGDAVCSQISPEMFDEFAAPLQKELFDFIHEKGALVKLHICGDISHILPSLSKEGVDILDVDWMVDMARAYEAMGPDTMLCGNLDPVSVIMNGDKALIKQKFDEARASLPAENWILMGGCEIPMSTPVENMVYLREISK